MHSAPGDITASAATTTADTGSVPTVAAVLSAEVRDALQHGRPVVALESTIIAHGLPRPDNLVVAREFEDIVRAAGACPATIAVIDGHARVGLTPSQLERVALDPTVRKLGMRDLPVALAATTVGATTVSATAFIAARAGIRVFATGGIGGVHRGWVRTWDESADLGVLGSERITVVCAGVKSILDVPATLQRLETLNVTVVGYGTDEFPGFYLSSSGLPVDWRVDDPGHIAAIMRNQDALSSRTALLVANPVSTAEQLDPVLHDEVLTAALRAADAEMIDGQAITPYLLEYLVNATNGASLRANLAAVRANIALASHIAVCWATGSTVGQLDAATPSAVSA
jgi:pseudouridine-5'-phosphate glycosidase